MATAAHRRQLIQSEIEGFDPCLTFDVNEYCIETWPTLTAKNRQTVWSSLQRSEEFDWSPIIDQIDQFIYEEAERNPRFVIPDTESEIDDDDESPLCSALWNYACENWDGLEDQSQDKIDGLFEKLITTIDEVLNDFFNNTDDEN